MSDVSAIPAGYHTITPYLVVAGAADAIAFYRRAFGAEELYRHAVPGGDQIMNAALRIGDSLFMLNDEMPDFGCLGPRSGQPSPVTIHLYVEDVDAFFARAVEAGAEVVLPVSDAFWGDRYGQLRDPFGHAWSVATHTEELTDEQIMERAQQAFPAPGGA